MLVLLLGAKKYLKGMIPVMLVYFVVIAVVSVNQKSNKGLLSDSISHPHGYAVHSM